MNIFNETISGEMETQEPNGNLELKKFTRRAS